jgi:16S rRNA pseudouridine516 synthase
MHMRIDALLSRYGYCSRSQARDWLKRGVVRYLNGVLVRNPAEKVAPAQLTVNGNPVEFPDGLFIKLHKPAGYVCSHSEEEGPGVFDLLPAQWMRRNPQPTVAGRLDKDTTGLVLITDDHQLVHRLISPKSHVPKTYLVELDRCLDPAVIALFASGTLMLDGEEKPCLPAALTIGNGTGCEVVLHEGRYHQVKRMFAACGYTVVGLHRRSIGDWELGDLEVGKWEALDINRLPSSS